MDFLTFAKKRYSVRAYTKQKVEKEKLDAILEAAHVANDACINIGQLFTIKGTCPDLICIAANDNCQRRTIDICGLSNFTKALITLHYNQVYLFR